MSPNLPNLRLIDRERAARQDQPMSALSIARRCLLVSAVVYATTLALGWLRAGSAELWFLTSIGAVFGIALSAAACVMLQMRIAFMQRGKSKSSV